MNYPETLPDTEHDPVLEELDAVEALADEVKSPEDEALVEAWKAEAAEDARAKALEAINANPMPKLVEHSGAVVTETARDEQLAAGQQAGSGSYDGRARY